MQEKINEIMDRLGEIQAYPIGLAQAYCARATKAAAIVAAEIESEEDPLKSLPYIYNLFDIRDNIRRALRYCSHEAIVYNNETREPYEELEEVLQQVEELISEPQQTDNEI